jgi:hypothetical protein
MPLRKHSPGEDGAEEQQESREDHPGTMTTKPAVPLPPRSEFSVCEDGVAAVAKQEQTDNVFQTVSVRRSSLGVAFSVPLSPF